MPAAVLTDHVRLLVRHLDALAIHSLLSFFQRLGEVVVELVERAHPVLVAVLDLIEIVLHFGCELCVNYLLEVILHQVCDDLTEVGRLESLALVLDIAA